MEIPVIIANIIGAIVFVVNIIGHSKLTARKVIFFNTVVSVLAIIQYCLLGAWTGVACCVISIARNIAFNRYKNKVPLYILLLYIAAVIAINFPLIHNVVDAFPVINISIYAIALWTKNIMAIKVVGLCTAVTGTTYNLIHEAYVAIATEAVLCVVRIRAIYQLKKQKNTKKLNSSKKSTPKAKKP